MSRHRAGPGRGLAARSRGTRRDADAACPEPVVAQACDGHLEQILDNLLANALDALSAGRSIRVGATAAGGPARVTVADDGQGMSREQQRAAFRRFATGRPGGTGLGLAIVDRLATANGGSAAISDTPGGGLTVTIELPLETARRPSRRPATLSRAIPAILTSSERVLNRSRATRRAGLLTGRIDAVRQADYGARTGED